jgi:hypothetical protein
VSEGTVAFSLFGNTTCLLGRSANECEYTAWEYPTPRSCRYAGSTLAALYCFAIFTAVLLFVYAASLLSLRSHEVFDAFAAKRVSTNPTVRTVLMLLLWVGCACVVYVLMSWLSGCEYDAVRYEWSLDADTKLTVEAPSAAMCVFDCC